MHKLRSLVEIDLAPLILSLDLIFLELVLNLTVIDLSTALPLHIRTLPHNYYRFWPMITALFISGPLLFLKRDICTKAILML